MGISKEIIPIERIAGAIHLLRGQRVMLDFDLAALYGVTTKVLNQARKRHRNRFPNDFMFRLTNEEVLQAPGNQLIRSKWSRSVTSSNKHGGLRYRPYAFTEDEKIDAILEAIRQLMAPPEKPRREIGFHVRETAPRYRTRKS